MWSRDPGDRKSPDSRAGTDHLCHSRCVRHPPIQGAGTPIPVEHAPAIVPRLLIRTARASVQNALRPADARASRVRQASSSGIALRMTAACSVPAGCQVRERSTGGLSNPGDSVVSAIGSVGSEVAERVVRDDIERHLSHTPRLVIQSQPDLWHSRVIPGPEQSGKAPDPKPLGVGAQPSVDELFSSGGPGHFAAKAARHRAEQGWTPRPADQPAIVARPAGARAAAALRRRGGGPRSPRPADGRGSRQRVRPRTPCRPACATRPRCRPAAWARAPGPAHWGR